MLCNPCGSSKKQPYTARKYDSLDAVGVDNITFETDYPHSDSTWPDTKDVATELLGHLPDDVVHKIVRGNAIRMLGLPLAP